MPTGGIGTVKVDGGTVDRLVEALNPNSDGIRDYRSVDDVETGEGFYDGVSVTTITVTDLNPVTEYIVFIVLQGESQDSLSEHPYIFRFSTGDVARPKIELFNNTSSVGVRTSEESRASWFTMEMYKLTGDGRYLDNMYKLLCVYYSIGGEEFYPNGLSIYESVEVLRSAGREEMAEKLLQFYKRHIDRIVETGVYYPEHEVNYEQAIVTPAVTLTAQLCLLTKNKELLAPCREQLRILEKFNGHQPSHHLYEMSIRHWDGYWFGKRQNYGDTFPHPASIHTANAYLHYAMISGDENYRKKAYQGARNLLSLFRPDGSASNCYVYPFSVNGVRCEYYDEYANDQDGALYYLMKFYRFEEGASPLSAAAEKVQDLNS
jgi:hypothetical protein